MNFITKNKYIILSLTIILFIFIELLSINVPDIGDNEAYFGVETLKLINNLPTLWDINFLNRHLPCSSDGKHGALECYLLAPFLLLGGHTLIALRLAAIFFGILILILTYYFCSRFFNNVVGIMTVVFLVLNSTFINVLKMGGTSGFGFPLFTLSPLLCFLIWHRTRKNAYFYIGMFIIGLGFNTKGWFIWFVLALLIALLTTYRPYKKIRFKMLILSLMSMILGLAPIVYYYFKTHFYNFIFRNTFITQNGVNNLSVFKNLQIRANQLYNMLVANSYLHSDKRLDAILFFLYLICLAWLLYLIVFRKRTILSKNIILFILLLFLITFVMSIFTFTTLDFGHLYILFPFPEVIIAISIFEMWCYNKRIFYRAIVFLFSGMLLFSNITGAVENYRNLKAQESRLFKASQLTDYLLQNRIYNLVFIEYQRLYWSTQFLSNLKIKGDLYSIYDSDFIGKLKDRIKNVKENDVFIFNFKETQREYELFNLFAKEFNKTVITCKRFYVSDGSLAIVIHSLE